MDNVKTNRNAGIELLRMLAMFAIVFGHFISHGGGFTTSEKIGNPLYITEQLVTSFTAFKINIFILITGFFMCGIESFSIKKRLSNLWKNEMFYSIAILLIFVFGSMPVGIIQIIKSIFPTISYSYWFVTVYVVLILISPIINRAFSKMDKGQYKKSLFVMVIITSVWQTVMPFVTTVDNNRGYSLLWFLVLYVTGGYLKRYFVGKYISKKKLISVYLICSVIQFVYMEFYTYVQNKTAMEMYIPYYNSFFVLCASIALFLLFYQIKISDGFGKIITFISGSLISIYLISDNQLVRNVLYTDILKTGNYLDKGVTSILAVTIMVLIVFVICLIIDVIKRLIIGKVKK